MAPSPPNIRHRAPWHVGVHAEVPRSPQEGSKTAQESSKTASQGFLGLPGCRKLGKTTRSEELLVDGPFAGPPAGQPARRVHSRGPGVAAAAAAFTGNSAPRPTQPVDTSGCSDLFFVSDLHIQCWYVCFCGPAHGARASSHELFRWLQNDAHIHDVAPAG